MGTSKDVERKIIWELTDLLRKNADSLLSGQTKLCLTTSSLCILDSNFARVNQLSADERNVQAVPRRHNILNRMVADQELWKDNVHTLHDFLLKTVALKIIHVSYTIKAPVQIARFCSLQVLELKKVPIHLIEGLSKLRGQLRELIISRSLQKLQDVLEICGGDRSSGLTWQNLKSTYLGFNFITDLDNSLRFAPFLEVLDISHNNIRNAEDYLQNLTDLLRVNLGYNLLDAVPQFSYSNKGKLRTLVLRNNNLDNLEGIQELTALEELDLTENCLADHRCLATLSRLNKLCILSLIGNPLSYKNEHRNITLSYISPMPRMGTFLLDGKRLSAYEITILKETVPKCSTDQMDSFRFSNSGDDSTTFDLTDGDTSDSRNNSLVVPGSHHSRKKKRGHRRMHSKERIPKITNIEDSTLTQSLPTSKSSPAGSFIEDPDELAAIEQKKQHVERLRNHLKDDWLKALYAEQQDHYQQVPAETQSTIGTDCQTTVHAEITDGVADTMDDVGRPISNENDRILMSDDIPPPTPTNTDSATDIYMSREKSPMSPTAHMAEASAVDTKGAEWTRSNRQQAQYYGEESDPFIVMLPSDDMKQILITVNDRYILEKDLSGTCQEMMDLKCLLSIKHSEEPLSGNDIVWGVMFPVVTLKFDYVRRDMQLRRYAMEDMTFAQQLGDLLQPHVTARGQQLQQQMECLKCKHQFVKPRLHNTELRCCPQCGSKIVFELTSESLVLDSGQPTKTDKDNIEVVVNKMSSGVSPKQSPKLARTIAMRRKETKTEVTKSPQMLSEISFMRPETGRRMSEGFIVGDTLKETVDSMIPDLRHKLDTQPMTTEDTRRHATDRQGLYVIGDEMMDNGEQPVSNNQATSVVLRDGNIQRTASTDQIHQTIHTQGMVQHHSWSDLQKSRNHAGGMVPNLSLSDMQKLSINSAMRSSISSVESDITVLGTNSSHGSVTASSQSSRDCLINSSKINSGLLPEYSSKNGHSKTNNISGDVREGVDLPGERDTQRKTTPAGSPLSSSVCSSMVSSVYENTLAGAGDNTCDNGVSHDAGNASSSDDSVTFRNNFDANCRSDSERKRNVEFRGPDLVYLNGTTDISANGELSVYKSAESSFAKMADLSKFTYTETDTTVSEKLIDPFVPSIYDSVSSTHFLDSNTVSNSDISNHDLSNISNDDHSTNDDSTDSSRDVPPFRRGKCSRKSRRKRNSKFSGSEGQIQEYSKTNPDLENGVSSQETGATAYLDTAHSSFPADLSPIKRVSSSRTDHNNRSAVYIDPEMDNDNMSVDVSRTSVLSSDRNDTENDESVGNVSHSTADMRLPWDSEESTSKETSLSHEEFINIDHRLQLYLELKVFRAVETCQCAIQSNIVQYMKHEPVDSFLVISTTRILIFNIHGNPDSDISSDWLKCYEDQPITELQFIDIGLGYQTLRLEFDTECSSYTLVIADEGRCKRILTLLTDILQNVSLSGHSKLEGISKSVPGTMSNLETAVLQPGGDREPQDLVKYLMVSLTDAEGDSSTVLGVVVTTSDVVLVEVNHQWPLPRLQAPLGDLKGKQFQVKQREEINNIETLEFNEYNPCELRMSFFDEGADEKLVWLFTMESKQGVKSLVEAIRAPWESEFGVSLDITPVSFSD